MTLDDTHQLTFESTGADKDVVTVRDYDNVIGFLMALSGRWELTLEVPLDASTRDEAIEQTRTVLTTGRLVASR